MNLSFHTDDCEMDSQPQRQTGRVWLSSLSAAKDIIPHQNTVPENESFSISPL